MSRLISTISLALAVLFAILTTATIDGAAFTTLGLADAAQGGTRFCGVSPTGRYQIRANRVTSCPFARRVTRRVAAYQRRHGGIRQGERFRVRAGSPVTGRVYRMRCRAARGLPYRVTCRGGRGALVRMVAAG
jgi:hypothetical protein